MSKTLMFYINTLGIGGAERVIIELAKNFALSGYRSILVSSFTKKDEYPVPENVERISIEQSEIKSSKLSRNFRRIRALRKLCKQHKPLALISFMGEPNFRAVMATWGLKVKTIISVRNDPNREYAGKVFRFVGKKILPKADGCVFQTEDAKKWFPIKLQKKSKVIANAVSLDFFNTEYAGGNSIVTLGRLNSQKNHKLLIDAFSEICQDFPNVNLEIYGEGVLRESLQEQINALTLQNRVFLKGRTADSKTVLKNSKAFVLSSDYEGMPNALMEALAVGVPSISTDCPCGGPKGLIKDGENGLLVKAGDKEDLKNALIKILGDDNFAKTLGENAKKMADSFKPDIVFNEWKEYVEQIIATR